jgi:hypothetical protein
LAFCDSFWRFVQSGNAQAEPDHNALIGDLERLATAPYGVWGARPEELPALGKLGVVSSMVGDDPSDHQWQTAFAEVLAAALRLEPATWREGAVQLFGLGEASESTESRPARERLAAEAEGKDLRTFRSRAKIRGEKSYLDFVFRSAADKLLRLEHGAKPPPPTLPHLEEDATLEDVRHALRRLHLVEPAGIVPNLLAPELIKVVRKSYHTFLVAHESHMFLSWTPALALRMNIHDPEDTMYVLSRRDESIGIRQDPGWDEYRAWMGRQVEEQGKDKGRTDGINHVRLLVRSDPAPLEEGADELWDCHGENSLYTLTSEALRVNHEVLHDFPFGFILSAHHDYALLTVPPQPEYPEFRLQPGGLQEIRAFVGRFPHDGDHLAGNMRSLVTADPEVVRRLRAAFVAARDDHRHTQRLK